MELDIEKFTLLIDELLDETDGDFCLGSTAKIGECDAHGKQMQIHITVTADDDDFIENDKSICLDFMEKINGQSQ